MGDFHALRHTYITRIVGSGASVKVAQELARHSTPTLTIGRYAHTRLHDLSTALESLPESPPTGEREAMRATGTDGAGPQQYAQQRARETAQTGASRCADDQHGGSTSEAPQGLQSATLCESVRPDAPSDAKATGRTRTVNLRFTKPLLCH